MAARTASKPKKNPPPARFAGEGGGGGASGVKSHLCVALVCEGGGGGVNGVSGGEGRQVHPRNAPQLCRSPGQWSVLPTLPSMDFNACDRLYLVDVNSDRINDVNKVY